MKGNKIACTLASGLGYSRPRKQEKKRIRMDAVNPTPEQLQKVLADTPKDQPVVMLNLLRFRDRANYKEEAPERSGRIVGHVHQPWRSRSATGTYTDRRQGRVACAPQPVSSPDCDGGKAASALQPPLPPPRLWSRYVR